MPDVDILRAGRYAIVLDVWIVRRSWIEDVIKVACGQIGISRRVEQ